ncbi:uncharacterized protein LOC105381092 [Plutella xylostella]|uniref:uncharacterized protein LOC105381092 n=1 Tax=Plutella xylostella TaxID=51655 RepID=UPI0020330E5E|nr:uncharacterized protein LOC105381092 [Plutella xylostella]
MRAHGRITGRAAPRLLCLFALFTATATTDYGVPIEIQLWDTGRTPLAHMVDVTNEFGLKVLAEHNFLNENNIAFSPYGLTGILVALYEGVDGECSFQIQRGMQLPWNRNVMRIGFRDIHRTLKTYFVPEEGFLAGLALNNENVTFNDSYKKILRFYGFDLEKPGSSTVPPQTNNTAATEMPATAGATPTSAGTTPTQETTTPAPAPEQPTREETTPNPNAETISDVDVRIPTTTAAPSSAVNAEFGPVTDTTTTAPITATEQAATAELVTETMPPAPPTMTEAARTETDATTTESMTMTMAMETAMLSTNSETTTVTSMATEQETTLASTPITTTTSGTTVQDLPTTTSAQELVEATDASNVDAEPLLMMPESTTAGGPMESSDVTEATTDTETIPTTTEKTVTNPIDSKLETLERRKKSIVDFILTNPPYVDDYLIYRSYDIPPEGPTLSFDGSDQMFLANGLKKIQVSYMHYDTILEHAYLPHLDAAALRLPLDSDRYYLLVVLPTQRGPEALGRLVARMARESDLRDVHAAMTPRRVRAVVPSFTVKGHVTLTTDLQKLGIRDVFEPRQRDFTPMTSQGHVYVRSVEQAVSVAIRKYRHDDQKRNRYVANRHPVQFSATYPFVYFVMDASIHVCLMAGKMVDPLNSRIL